jgi:putative phosphonate catabolism associated alcohol dehydrogenase
LVISKEASLMSRAVVFTGPGNPLELVRFPAPEPRDGEILVRVTCCTLCRSDLHTHAGRRTEPTPTILGHEIVGRIEAFGPSAPRVDARGVPVTVGSRISWAVAVGCGSCFFCAEDIPQKCERPYKYGHQRMASDRPHGGGLSDFIVLVPGTVWLQVPDAIPDTVAAPANCATATVAALLRYADLRAGQTVLVLGAGVLGVTACAMARAAGARAVVVSDTVQECRDRAIRFGATHTFLPSDAACREESSTSGRARHPTRCGDAACREESSTSGAPQKGCGGHPTHYGDELTAGVHEITHGRGADVVLELAGTARSAQAGLSLVRTGGTLVLAGTVAPVGTIALDPEQVVRRMLTIRGVHNYHPRDLATALEFLSGLGRDFPWSSLVVAEYPLEQAEQAFATAHARPGVRVAVVPGPATQE